MAKSLDRVTRYAKLANFSNANALMVTVLYDKGGMNYFNYKVDPRGYYVAVRPVMVADRDSGFESVSYPMFDDAAFKVLLKPVARLNAKSFKEAALKVLPLIPQLAYAYETGMPDVARQLLHGVSSELQEAA